MKRREFLQALGIGVIVVPFVQSNFTQEKATGGFIPKEKIKNYPLSESGDITCVIRNQEGRQILISHDFKVTTEYDYIDVSSIHEDPFTQRRFIPTRSSSILKVNGASTYDYTALINSFKSSEYVTVEALVVDKKEITFNAYVYDMVFVDDMKDTAHLDISFKVTGAITLT